MPKNRQDHETAVTVSVHHDDDAALVTVLAEQGYDGPLWASTIRGFQEYAWKTLHGVIYSGAVDEVAIGTMHPTLRSDLRHLLRDSTDHRDELVVEAILWAPEKFRAHLMANRWDSTKGKSLRSYFFGTAVSGFWEAYKKWMRRLDNELQSAFGPVDFDLYPAHEDDIAQRLSDQADIRQILQEADPLQRQICDAVYKGHTQAEAAASLQLTNRAVEVRMRNLRRDGRRLAKRGLIDGRWAQSRRPRPVTTKVTDEAVA